jgi:hypothetical protein
MHHLLVPRLIHSIVGGRRSVRETSEIANDILARATDVKTLHTLIYDLAKQIG